MKGRYESEADTGNRIHCGMCNNEVEEGYTLIPDKATKETTILKLTEVC